MAAPESGHRGVPSGRHLTGRRECEVNQPLISSSAIGETVAHGRPTWVLPKHQISAAERDEERPSHGASSDEKERLLRNKGRIRKRWARFFRSLLNAKSDMLDPDILRGCLSNQSRVPSGSNPRRRKLPQQ